MHRFSIALATAVTVLAGGGGATLALAHSGHGYGAPQPAASGKARDVSRHASRVAESAYLTGADEVDADGPEAGDPDAKGTATFLSVDERTLCYGFMVRGAQAPTKVHIHKGAPGTNGPVVLEFANVPKDAAGKPAGSPGASSGCKTAASPEEQAVFARIRRHPERYYVNMHTASFPDGALRGQLSRLKYLGD